MEKKWNMQNDFESNYIKLETTDTCMVSKQTYM